MTTLGEDLPKQMARVRDEVMPAYREIGQAGAPALLFMQDSLNRAAKAMAEGDLSAMIEVYEELKHFKT